MAPDIIRLPLDKTIDQQISIQTENYVTGIALLTEMAKAEDVVDGYPGMDSDELMEYLEGRIEIGSGASDNETSYREDAIHWKSVELNHVVLALDIHLEEFFGDDCTIATDAILVNLPAVMAAIETCQPDSEEVTLVLVEDFFMKPPLEGDERCDAVFAVRPWHGSFICRPALIDRETAARHFNAKLLSSVYPRPNVRYQPRFGLH